MNAHIERLKKKIAEDEYNRSRSFIKENYTPSSQGSGTISNNLSAKMNNAKMIKENKTKTLNDAKKALVTETLFGVFKKSLVIEGFVTDTDERLMYNYIDNFIKECGGATNVIKTMESASELTSNIALNINNKYNKILEKCNQKEKEYNEKEDDVNTLFKIDEEDDFFNTVDDKDTEGIVDEIKVRVGEALDTFIEKNKEDKEEIETILKTAKDKVDSLNKENTDDAVAESYVNMANNKASMVSEKRSKSIFESMVVSLSKGVLKNDNIRESFADENDKLQMGKIIESVKIMYTFLEMVNTLQLKKVDTQYLSNIITELHTL